MDISQGQQLAHMRTPTVHAVVSRHPSQGWIAAGKLSRKVFLFADSHSVEVKEQWRKDCNKLSFNTYKLDR